MSDLALRLPDEFVDALAEAVSDRIGSSGRQYMTSAETQVYLRMEASRLGKLCSGAIRTVRPIPFRKEGKHRIFVRQELDEWLDSGGAELA